MKDLVAGFSYYNCPGDGLGPFRKLFPTPRRIVKFSDLEMVDVVILWGGADISPSLYKEEPITNSGPIEPSYRDIYEWEIMKYAHSHNIPIIGVCRGAQIMCAYAGGSLVQDISNHNCGTHSIDTYLDKQFVVTSGHHQMLNLQGVDHQLLAWANGNRSKYYLPLSKKNSSITKEPEVVYFPTINGFAIQSHPEWEPSTSEFLPWMLNQIKAFCFSKEKVA